MGGFTRIASGSYYGTSVCYSCSLVVRVMSDLPETVVSWTGNWKAGTWTHIPYPPSGESGAFDRMTRWDTIAVCAEVLLMSPPSVAPRESRVPRPDPPTRSHNQ